MTLGFLFFASVQLLATHIVGGELYYKHTGGTNYELVLIVYRDCDSDNANNTGFDGSTPNLPNPVVGVYNNGNLIGTESLPFSVNNVEELPILSENPCFILPPDLCIEKATYTTFVSLPPISGGYDLVYQRCCRNNSIINVMNPADAGMSLFAHIPGEETSAAGINQSAKFNNLPNVALCQGAEFSYDHSATDEDGDQLSYSFCTPFLGGGSNVNAPNGALDSPQPDPPAAPPFTPVVWNPGFNQDYQLTSDPGLEIDPTTGQISGTPTQIGTFVVGVCVQEFRNGQLINTIIRDFQYEVTSCDPVIIAAIPSQEQFCDGLTFQFENSSVNASFFLWDFGDLSITTDTSTAQSPLYTYAQEGDYQVSLIANPGWPCADTSTADYSAYPPLIVFNPEIEFNCVDDVPIYDIQATGSYDEDESAITWNFPQTLNVNGTNEFSETVTNPNGGLYEISVTITENGCDQTHEFDLEVPEAPEAILPAQSMFCEGFTFDFENNSLNAETYTWDFGVPSLENDVSNEFQPSYTYPTVGSYIVTLGAYAPMTCPSITESTFEIEELLDPFFENPESQCFTGHSFDFNASGFSDDIPIINWHFGELATPTESDTQVTNNVTWSEAGIYPVTLTISENDCTKFIEHNVEIIENPIPDFDYFNSEGCPPITVTFSNQSSGGQNLSYLWNFGDGSTSNLQNPTHDYDLSGLYDISLTVTSDSGCLDEVTLLQPEAIHVYPSPIAGFSAESYQLSFLEPTVTITDTSVGATSCTYDMGDGTTYLDCEFMHDFLDAGFFDVTQTVINDFGCTDQLNIPFTVEGHFFYAPNAFTPDSDDLNELYLPTVIGVSSYQFRIFNRWGEKIFETTDHLKGWDGSVNNGAYYSPNGVYSYQIILRDLLGFPHEYSGHISLIR